MEIKVITDNSNNVRTIENGTKEPICRNRKEALSLICLEGCIDEVFYIELPTQETGGPIHDGEKAMDSTCFSEIARVTLSPKTKNYGIQIPAGTWHSIEAKEHSVIYEVKDCSDKG